MTINRQLKVVHRPSPVGVQLSCLQIALDRVAHCLLSGWTVID